MYLQQYLLIQKNNILQPFYKNISVLFFTYLCYTLFVIQGYIGVLGGSVVEISYFLTVLLPLCLTLRHINRIVLVIIVFIPIYFINKSFITVFFIYSFIYLFRGQPINRIAAVNVFIGVIVFILLPILLETGVTKDEVSVLDKGVAHSLGFGNSNSLGLAGFYLMISIYVFFVRRCKWPMWFFLIVANQIIYTYACSRTACISGNVLILTSFILFTFGIKKKFRYIIALAPILFTAIIYFILFDWQSYGVLDVFLSRRISILGGILEEFNKLNWLVGKNIEDGIPIDCAYVGIIIAGGIGWLSFFLIAEWQAVVHRFRYIYIYIPVVFAMFISVIGENTFISPNGASILFWYIILNLGMKHKSITKTSEYQQQS